MDGASLYRKIRHVTLPQLRGVLLITLILQIIGTAQVFLLDLSKVHGIMAAGITEWGTTPKDFFERKTAIMWTTTGNLTNVRANAKFDFGVAMLPAGKQRGSPTGGGNFYLFKKSTPAQRDAQRRVAVHLGAVDGHPGVGETERLGRPLHLEAIAGFGVAVDLHGSLRAR